jgi:hypothetical protein
MGIKNRLLLIILIFTISLLIFSGCTENIKNENNDLTNNEELLFNYPPVDLNKVAFIEPMGSMIGNHVTPIDHQYYISKDFFGNQELKIDVYSPADGEIINIQHMGSFDSSMDDYRFEIKHTDSIISVYIHVDKLSEKIAKYAPSNGAYVNVNIPVSAGEIIGNYSGSVDYNVVDYNITLTGFINPESYKSEPWKIHIPDPFDYFNDSIKKKLIDKCLRSAEPIGGKIDYDIDGRLVGNWFIEGTNGYEGVDQKNYWTGHLAISYSSINPDHIIVSLGSFKGEPKQFGVKNNSPNPANVSIESGLVKYDLVEYDFYNNSIRWDRASLVKGLELKNYNFSHGVVLFQLIEERKLKVEIFPDGTYEEINSFTDNFSLYVR